MGYSPWGQKESDTTEQTNCSETGFHELEEQFWLQKVQKMLFLLTSNIEYIKHLAIEKCMILLTEREKRQRWKKKQVGFWLVQNDSDMGIMVSILQITKLRFRA